MPGLSIDSPFVITPFLLLPYKLCILVKIFTKQTSINLYYGKLTHDVRSIAFMNTISFSSYVNSASNFYFPQSTFVLIIESAVSHNTSIYFPIQLCNYYKKYYRKRNFSHLQEAQMNYVTIIRNLREDSDKTQQEIAEFLGTSQTMYARYERGANEMPIRHLLKLAQYYNVSLDYLCGLSTLKRPYPII